MKHYGDITQIHGDQVPIVDVVTGGSPCQDLSVAGKRAGLAGERSGLFMEQIRIIKEMRNESIRQLRMQGANVNPRMVKPRFMVWENVPGAFSSNKGEDFRAVLEETAKVADENAVIPGPEINKGKWTPSGCIMGDGWSIAWRVHDAQFWGVPQRRKRIALVADFAGGAAPEILFERKSMSGDTETGREEGQSIAGAAGSGVAKTGRAISFQERGGKPGGGKGILIQDEHTGALSTLNNQSVCYGFEPGAAQRLNTEGRFVEEASPTLRTKMGDNQASVVFTTEMTPKVDENGVSFSLRSRDYKDPQAVVYGISSDGSNAMRSDNPHSGIYEAETTRTLDNNGGNPACNQGGMIVLEGNGSRPSHQGNGYVEGEISYTLNAVEQHAVCIENHPADSRVKISEDGTVQTLSGRMGTGGNNVPMVMEPYTSSKASYHQHFTNDGKAETLVASDYKDPPTVTYGLDRASFNQGQNAQYNFQIDEEKIGTQVAKGPGAVCQSVVRRLTPMECERLQGFPDHWTDIGEWIDSKGKKHKDADSPRYKALGNSIALPFWEWMAKRMRKYLHSYPPGQPMTMASLFDGIGGFPLSFGRAGFVPVWASEIEEFPIAVTKLHFSDDNVNICQ